MAGHDPPAGPSAVKRPCERARSWRRCRRVARVMGAHDMIVLTLAAFGAGVLNTIAGGGTFLTFPALVFTGLPPVLANATSAVAVFPGYLAGALGFRRELAGFGVRRLVRLGVVTAAGGTAGSLLLLVSSNAVFAGIVPALLFIATLLFLAGDRLQRAGARRRPPAGAALALFLVGVYGGYFNGGLGIMLLALFAQWGMRDLHAMNGLKGGLSFVLSLMSVATFALAGLVAWPQAILMALASTAGGYLGAPLARMLPRPVLRAAIGCIGFGMTMIFALRAWG